MHGTQKLSLLDLSVGIMTPPTIIIDYPTYVACQQTCSDSQNYRSYGEKKYFSFLPWMHFSYTKCMERRLYTPWTLCRDCDTTYPYPTISLGIKLLNKHALPRSITVVKAKYSWMLFFYHRCIFPIRNAWNIEITPPPLAPFCRDCHTSYTESSIRLGI